MVPRVLTTVLLLASVAAAQTADWRAQASAALARGDLPAVLSLTEARLRDDPSDLEARQQHARVLAWTGKWSPAEMEYRQLLQAAPHDVDARLGLCDVLIWQDKLEEALTVLDGGLAQRRDSEFLFRRGRILQRLGRTALARGEFLAVLQLDPHNREARTHLDALREYRHELRFGAAAETYNNTDATGLQSLSWRASWSPQWATEFAFASHQRFGFKVQRVAVQVDRRFAHDRWLSLGTVQSSSGMILARREVAGEFGYAFRIANRLFRGAEVSARQRGLWFDAAHVAVTTAAALVYLPRDWTFLVRLSGSRSSFAATGVEWQPSGAVRLAFPVAKRIEGRASFGLGAENYSNAEQIGHFFARQFGAGARLLVGPSQDLIVNVARQFRSRGVTQASVEVGYAVRF